VTRGESERDGAEAGRPRGDRAAAVVETRAGEPSGAPGAAEPGDAGSTIRARAPIRKRRWLKVLLAAASLVVIVYALRVPILVGMARAVEVHQPPLRSDLIFLLSGDARTAGRAQHAASLYRRGFAPRIVMARSEDPPAGLLGLYPNDTEVNAGILQRAGVPDSAIAIITAPGGATSTIHEGRLLAWYLRRHPADRVLLVTSEYHTRRARWAIRRGLAGEPVELRVSGARDPRFHAGNWWRSEAGLLAYFAEYVKWAHNVVFR
jgi:uncharacterized SAM-binding protein YcdF (DUF218 family)